MVWLKADCGDFFSFFFFFFFSSNLAITKWTTRGGNRRRRDPHWQSVAAGPETSDGSERKWMWLDAPDIKERDKRRLSLASLSTGKRQGFG